MTRRQWWCDDKLPLTALPANGRAARNLEGCLEDVRKFNIRSPNSEFSETESKLLSLAWKKNQDEISPISICYLKHLQVRLENFYTRTKKKFHHGNSIKNASYERIFRTDFLASKTSCRWSRVSFRLNFQWSSRDDGIATGKVSTRTTAARKKGHLKEKLFLVPSTTWRNEKRSNNNPFFMENFCFEDSEQIECRVKEILKEKGEQRKKIPILLFFFLHFLQRQLFSPFAKLNYEIICRIVGGFFVKIKKKTLKLVFIYLFFWWFSPIRFFWGDLGEEWRWFNDWWAWWCERLLTFSKNFRFLKIKKKI